MSDADGTALLTAALAYAQRGWPVFPCKLSKQPWTVHGFQDASTDVATIQRWWDRQPQASIGVATGQPAGFFVLDVDPRHGGDDVLAALCRTYRPLPHTLQSLTGGGGTHYFFRHPGDPLPNQQGRLGDGLDIRGDGGYVILPPSPHPSGRAYEWEVTAHPEETRIADAPAWLLALLRDTARPAPIQANQPIPAGQRNATLTRLAGSMRRAGWSAEALFAALCEENTAHCHPPLADTEVRQIARSVARYAPDPGRNGPVPSAGHTPAATSPRTPFGDVFNAEALARLHGDALRYCARLGGWLLWSGTHWQRDETGQSMERARRTIRTLIHEAANTDDSALLKHASGCLAHHTKLTALLAQAATFPTIAVLPEVFDTNPWLLNCQNGTVDLRTGRLSPHDPADAITKCVPIPYEPQARCPEWQRFLWRVMGGTQGQDADDASAATLEARHQADEKARRLIGFLQRAVGYALTGLTNEDCLFLLYGNGRNGKSRFLDACHAMLDAYAKAAQMSTFLHQDKETVRNDLADLHGVRFVSAIETSEGRRFSEGLIKQLTGGDRIKARFLFKEYFEFLPNFKIFLAFNHKPDIRGTDTAIWERIKLIPFDVFIPPEDRDKYLKEKLHAELSGILAWAVQGCLAWQKDGLQEPDEVKVATENYRNEMDVLGQFIDECCVTGAAFRCKASQLYDAYKEWAGSNHEYAMTQTAFGRELTSRGYEANKEKGRVAWRLGLALREE